MLGILSRTLGVSTDYLLGNDPQISKGVKIPVLGRVQAGIPIEAIEDILDYEEIEPELAETGEFFALQIKGDSMAVSYTHLDVYKRQPSISRSSSKVRGLGFSSARLRFASVSRSCLLYTSRCV